MFLNLLVGLAIALLVGIYTKAYIATDPTLSWYKRLYAALKASATMGWSALVIFSTKTLDVFGLVADQFSAGVGDQLRSVVDPKYGAAIIVGIMVVTIIARLRTLWSK